MSAIDDLDRAKVATYGGVWSWEPHGDGWALYVDRGEPIDPELPRGFGNAQHGYNILTVDRYGFDRKGEALRAFILTAADKVPALRAERDAERQAWARLVSAVIDDRDAQFAEEQEQPGAEAWRERTSKALEAAKQGLRDVGVEVDKMLEGS